MSKINGNGSSNNTTPKNFPFVSTEGETSVQTIPRVETPKMYKVILLNDDYTPMEFVVLVLRRFFGKNEDEATKIMLDVHKKGAGVAGVFTLEVAEMKVMQVNQYSQMNEHPLKSTLEEE
jgi:ATP-dependent Clp protease adaptor protein ClpS